VFLSSGERKESPSVFLNARNNLYVFFLPQMYAYMDDLTEGHNFRRIDYLYNINSIDPIIPSQLPLRPVGMLFA